jgi:hypothetical protein
MLLGRQKSKAIDVLNSSIFRTSTDLRICLIKWEQQGGERWTVTSNECPNCIRDSCMNLYNYSLNTHGVIHRNLEFDSMMLSTGKTIMVTMDNEERERKRTLSNLLASCYPGIRLKALMKTTKRC